MIALAATLGVLAVALATDRLIGDPPVIWARIPHPIALFGRAVDWLDTRFNDPAADARTRRRNGVAALLLLVIGAGAIGWLLQALLRSIPLGFAIEAVIVSVFLAEKSLVDHVAAVERALVDDGLEGGRQAVAKIVGRDVSVLNEAGVSRAAIESAAENFSDGVVAPAFWFLLLGLPGLFIYKLVNTADSMIGNRSPRHEAFGWAAARFDDLLNFVPARLSALLIAAAASLVGSDGGSALQCAAADARKHKSPNAGWPEAALAGALGLALGGPRRYGDIAVDGAWLNLGGSTAAGPQDIRAAIRVIEAAWALLTATASLAAALMIALAR